MPLVLVHISNEDPVLGEVDALPSPSDTMILVRNPRRKDGKDLHYLEASVSTVIWPVIRINFIEVIPSAEEEEVISHFRE